LVGTFSNTSASDGGGAGGGAGGGRTWLFNSLYDMRREYLPV